MKTTLIVKVNSQEPEIGKIKAAADFIRHGYLVAFPTETVYGLGADALNPIAVRNLFEMKKRPFDNPPIVHVGEIEDVHRLVRKIPPEAEIVMKRFWPGPLTLILKRSKTVPNVTVSNLDTIAVRMPKHMVAIALIKESGCPIAAPSANLAGRPSPTSAKHVLDDLAGRIDVVLDAGSTNVGVESTILDMTINPPQILRPGGVPYEVLAKLLERVDLNPIVTAQRELAMGKVRSPGMKHKHYAPDADMIVVEGEISAVVRKVKVLTESYMRKDYVVGVLATDETVEFYKHGVVKCLGSRKNQATTARNLFKLLREFESEHVDIIIAEGVPVEGLGLAVMNRLRKAAGYNIIKI